jgi:hypothetical protein
MSGNYDMFSCFAQFMKKNEVDLKQVKAIVMTHLMNLQSNFLTQFLKCPENELGWI